MSVLGGGGCGAVSEGGDEEWDEAVIDMDMDWIGHGWIGQILNGFMCTEAITCEYPWFLFGLFFSLGIKYKL